ncbi:MAG: zinc ribbon domain-containing protein [Nitrososphaerales archaeon]
MEKRCDYCNEKLDKEWNFCPNCGKSLTDNVQSQ